MGGEAEGHAPAHMVLTQCVFFVVLETSTMVVVVLYTCCWWKG